MLGSAARRPWDWRGREGRKRARGRRRAGAWHPAADWLPRTTRPRRLPGRPRPRPRPRPSPGRDESQCCGKRGGRKETGREVEELTWDERRTGFAHEESAALIEGYEAAATAAILVALDASAASVPLW